MFMAQTASVLAGAAKLHIADWCLKPALAHELVLGRLSAARMRLI